MQFFSLRDVRQTAADKVSPWIGLNTLFGEAYAALVPDLWP